MANIARELLKKQFIELTRDHNAGFSVGLVDESNFFEWNVCFEGPKNTLYEGGIYNATLSFPSDFPNHPPQMKFTQEMWHPNGVDIYNEQEKPEERWRPIWSVEGILVSVISMLNEPNLESPANVDAAVQLKNNIHEYKSKVRALARMC
ncbi:ubiquitin-conjugating enzyme E2 [Plasmodium falciparum NF54]|uniref:Ubiquitin-conjugating enzyme E2, putative n=3 Tax=Plasmodium (Laverania) TaxID=418107 RepID=A0A143ZY34_PLAF7|nr:ubiquitin-conjugating enzyme, putative [Plasmodium reichenowi]XP_024329016.1 ubiquitin-conjugating enzyme E2, putative [Plasmodium falciparum 3D7]KAF4330704.1 ubiquitin-conjugating enzyme E2 [Plasmodium falciparum NF54]SOS78443.1 ubiquitin-conjugating enzyme, putative [Plasmodium sp. gorilla clade G1]KYN98498.1 ubiquitin-conjugating enzyme, putative [Plasmodium reichenowi]PKC45144.1 ubiquitin-conjugating enzyme E2 [Plasmodium falciparum NF54]CZT62536.1 ubiquitin-conjugating enzyme E2, puta|eukprot:XP_024329016.1 ubiquitin-conjugating enzyme, putative [Plasmodium falciparum 3D7]